MAPIQRCVKIDGLWSWQTQRSFEYGEIIAIYDDKIIAIYGDRLISTQRVQVVTARDGAVQATGQKRR